MLRVAYHEALESANDDLVRLGALMVDALHHAIRALEKADTALAARIITGADQTADSGRRIEDACIELIWRQQPLAGELRAVTGMFEISTDLQRINHYIVDVTKHAVRLADNPVRPGLAALKRIASLTESNLKRAVEAFRARSLAEAAAVANDERYEKLYGNGIRELQAAIREDAELIGPATEMLFILTALQRIGEHAANIAWHTEEMLAA